MQIVFLNSYYEWSKSEQMKNIVNDIVDEYDASDYESTMSQIAYETGVCIEVETNDLNIYSTNQFNRGCLTVTNHDMNNYDYKQDFKLSDSTTKAYKIINNQFNNKTIVYGIKLDTNTYAFVSASLVPLDSTISILSSQFGYTTVFSLIISLLLAWFLSKKLSKPIVNLNNSAKEMAKGNYQVEFETGSDILELNELANTLNGAEAELAKTEQLRREFLANVTHDLKTPLTMIKAYSEMARDLNNNDETKRKENLNVIIDESDRLNLLVNDILNLSRMQADVDALELSNFDINELIKSVLTRYQHMEALGYKLIYKNKKTYMVQADKKRIEQVVYNLVNNAINYTGDNQEVYLTIDDLGDRIRVNVRDTGKGISKDDIDLIWDKYYKVDHKYKRVTVGTGVGLSIVKSVLTKHKVNYGVDTSKHGTTFYFELNKEK